MHDQLWRQMPVLFRAKHRIGIMARNVLIINGGNSRSYDYLFAATVDYATEGMHIWRIRHRRESKAWCAEWPR